MMNDTNHSFVIQGFDAFPSTLGQGDIVATHARVVDLLHSSTLKADEIDDVVSQFKQTGAVLNQNKAMATQSKKAIEANPKWLNRNDAKPLGNPTSPQQKKMMQLSRLLDNLSKWACLNKDAASLIKSDSTLISPDPSPSQSPTVASDSSISQSPPRKTNPPPLLGHQVCVIVLWSVCLFLFFVHRIDTQNTSPDI